MKKPLHHHLSDYFFPHRRNNHRPHLFSVTSVAILVLAILILEGAYLAQTKYVFFKTDFLASVLPGALVALANQDRATGGLSGVIENSLLSKAAQAAAEDMAMNGYFSHVSPDGRTPWYWLDQVGYTYIYAGQNLAVNFTDSENVETAWMNSPTHRANIVKPQYTQVGIGVANGIYEGADTTFVVQFFATPAAAKVAAASTADVPSGRIATPPAAANVLGSQTIGTGEPGAAAAAAPTPVSPGWLVRLLASPLHTLITVLAAFFVLIAAVFAIAVLVRKGRQHQSVVFGGAFLLVLIAGAMLFSSVFAGSVLLNSQAASVFMALP